MLLTPDDARLFAMTYYDKTSRKAWEESYNYICSMYQDLKVDSMGLDQILNEATTLFLKSMLKSYNIEEQTIDTNSLMFGYVKSLIMKALQLNKFADVIEGIIDFEIFIANISGSIIHDSKWNEVILKNAEQGYGTTFLFYYDKWEKDFYCCVMEFGRGGYKWIPGSNKFTFEAPIKHSVKYGDERFTGYLSYEIEDFVKCQQDIFDGKYKIEPVPGQYN